MQKKINSIFSLLLCFIFLTGCAHLNESQKNYESDIKKSANNIIKKWKDVTVLIKMVVKQKMVVRGREMNKEQSKMEILGTVISPDGLIVVSLADADPTSLLETMMHGSSGEMGDLKMDREITDIKIRFSKDTEIEAEFVLRDTDLDLGFIMPKQKLESDVPFVDLTDSVKPDVLDRILNLSKLGKIANEELSVNIERIHTIVDKPRTFYYSGMQNMSGGLGTPVFSLEKGKIIGIRVLRKTAMSHGYNPLSNSMFSGMRNMGFLPVILPASDIKEVADQVPNKK